jgi:hypothetical protein
MPNFTTFSSKNSFLQQNLKYFYSQSMGTQNGNFSYFYVILMHKKIILKKCATLTAELFVCRISPFIASKPAVL